MVLVVLVLVVEVEEVEVRRWRGEVEVTLPSCRRDWGRVRNILTLEITRWPSREADWAGVPSQCWLSPPERSIPPRTVSQPGRVPSFKGPTQLELPQDIPWDNLCQTLPWLDFCDQRLCSAWDLSEDHPRTSSVT